MGVSADHPDCPVQRSSATVEFSPNRGGRVRSSVSLASRTLSIGTRHRVASPGHAPRVRERSRAARSEAGTVQIGHDASWER